MERAQAFDREQDQICRDMQQWLVLDGAVASTWIAEVEGLLDAYYGMAVMENQRRLKTTS